MDDVYDVFLTFLKPEKKWMVPETDPSGGVCGDPMVDQQLWGWAEGSKIYPDPHHANCCREFPAVGDSVAAWKPEKKHVPSSECSYLHTE